MINIIVDNNLNLDLFADEAINLTSKFTDLSDISKVYGDFTKTFTVPASERNNYIFNNYYDPYIDKVFGYAAFNANVRVDCYIELNSIPFRYGKLQLESVKIENGQPTSYSVTFYSTIVSLKDKFGDDTLSDLDFSEYNIQRGINYTISRSYNRNDSVGPIIFPLISSNRVWRYGTGLTQSINDKVMDISTIPGAIYHDELKPAINAIHIIEKIEDAYDVSFSRDFFDTAAFRNLYLHLSKESGKMKLSDVRVINMDNAVASNSSHFNRSNVFYQPWQFYEGFITNNLSNELSIPLVSPTYQSGTPFNQRWSLTVTGCAYVKTTDGYNPLEHIGGSIYCKINDNIDNPNTDYDSVTLVEPGDILEESNGFKLVTVSYTFSSYQLQQGYSRIKFYFAPNADMNFNFQLRIKWGYENSGFSSFLTNTYVYRNYGGSSGVVPNLAYQQTIQPLIYISDQMPNMKISDFLSGIIKMFNLVLRPNGSNGYYVNTLNRYYSIGQELDITKYVDTSSSLVARPDIYKSVVFKYQEGKSILSARWVKLFGGVDELGYGDLESYQTNNSTSNLEIKLPFENVIFERLTDQRGGTYSINGDTNLQIATLLTEEYSPMNPKPMLFYVGGVSTGGNDLNYIMSDASTPGVTFSVNNAFISGNEDDIYASQIRNTLQFNTSINSFSYQTITYSLFDNYYRNTIANTYNPKQRRVTVDNVYLPPYIIHRLNLNDRIIIGDKQYKIDDYDINLLTGKMKITLFLNWYDDLVPFDNTTDATALDRDIIENNGNRMYYDIKINKPGPWSLYGTLPSWISLNKTSGVGPDLVTIKLENNYTNQVRSYFLTFYLNNETYNACEIRQYIPK